MEGHTANMSEPESHDAVATIWPNEVSIVCKPGTKQEFRQHIYGNREFMLARMIETCIENDCRNLSFRVENHED